MVQQLYWLGREKSGMSNCHMHTCWQGSDTKLMSSYMQALNCNVNAVNRNVSFKLSLVISQTIQSASFELN